MSRYLPMPALLSFALSYSAFTYGATLVAPAFDRHALPCFGERLRSRSALTCLLNRNYVDGELLRLLTNYSDAISETMVPTRTYTLDGSFPFGLFPMIPHLSHQNGRQIDLAFYYAQKGSTRFETRSPIGYFAFEYPDTERCPETSRTRRWDLRWLQPYLRDMPLDEERMRFMLSWLSQHKEEYGIKKVFLEPHLAQKYGNGDDVFRFQGCEAARHDDHIHIEIQK